MTDLDWPLLTAPEESVPEGERPWLPRLRPWEEPSLPIANREFSLIPSGGCVGPCLYGECRAPGTTMGCGGCCGCLRGCQGLHEQQETAPHVWTGDSA